MNHINKLNLLSIYILWVVFCHQAAFLWKFAQLWISWKFQVFWAFPSTCWWFWWSHWNSRRSYASNSSWSDASFSKIKRHVLQKHRVPSRSKFKVLHLSEKQTLITNQSCTFIKSTSNETFSWENNFLKDWAGFPNTKLAQKIQNLPLSKVLFKISVKNMEKLLD